MITGNLRALAAELGINAAELKWQDRALCAEVDPAIFHPEKGESTREAKSVCRACEVRAECLDYALETRQEHGIWGAMSAHQRYDILTARRRQAASAERNAA